MQQSCDKSLCVMSLQSLQSSIHLQCGDVAPVLHLHELRELWNPGVVTLPEQDNDGELEAQLFD